MAYVHVNPFLHPAGVVFATVNGLKSLSPSDMGDQKFDADFFEKKAIDTAIAAAIGNAKDTLGETDVRRFRTLSTNILRHVENSLETGFFDVYKIQEYFKWNLALSGDTTKEFRSLCNNMTDRMLELLEKKIGKSQNRMARKLDVTNYISRKLKNLNNSGDIFQRSNNIGARAEQQQVVYRDVFAACKHCGEAKKEEKAQPKKPEHEEMAVEQKNPLSASSVISIEDEESEEDDDEWKHMKFKTGTSIENIERKGGGKSRGKKKKKKKKPPTEEELLKEEEERKRKARAKRTNDFIQQDDINIETHQSGKKHAPPPSAEGKKSNPFLSKPPAEDGMPDVDMLSYNFADMPKLQPIASMPALRPLNTTIKSEMPALRPLNTKIQDMSTLRPLGSSVPKMIERSYPELRPISIDGRHRLTEGKDGVCPKCMKKFKEYVAQHHQNTTGTAIVFIPNKSVMEKLKIASGQQNREVDYDALVKSHVAIASSPNQRTLTTDSGNQIDLQGDNSFLFNGERTVKTSDTWSDDLGLKNKVVFHLHGSLLK
jgi:hypothetical protein